MTLLQRMRKKAAKNIYTNYRVVAVGTNRKGDIIGMTMNTPTRLPNTFNTHAECRLMIRYGTRIKKITIARFGGSGDLRPIEPCPQCQALARSYNIQIDVIEN